MGRWARPGQSVGRGSGSPHARPLLAPSSCPAAPHPIPSPVGTCPARTWSACPLILPPGLSQHFWTADTALCLSGRCVGVLDTTAGITGASAGTLRPEEGEAVEQMFRRQRGVFSSVPPHLPTDSEEWCARSQCSVQTQTTGPLPLHLSSTQDSGLSKSHLF